MSESGYVFILSEVLEQKDMRVIGHVNGYFIWRLIDGIFGDSLMVSGSAIYQDQICNVCQPLHKIKKGSKRKMNQNEKVKFMLSCNSRIEEILLIMRMMMTYWFWT